MTTHMMKPRISDFCSTPWCYCPPAAPSPLCHFHKWTRRIGTGLLYFGVGLAVTLTIAAICSVVGCASPGPSKDRLRDLLSQCRDANRQRVRIIKEYEASNCGTNPAQDFGTINFGEAGN